MSAGREDGGSTHSLGSRLRSSLPTTRNGWIQFSVVALLVLVSAWFTIGVLVSTFTIAVRGLSFERSITDAADTLTGGDFEAAANAAATARADGAAMAAAAQSAQLNVLSTLPVAHTALTNLANLSDAARDVSRATEDAVLLYGDLSGKNGSQKVFSKTTIDLAKIKDLPPRIDAINEALAGAKTSLDAITTDGPGAGLLGKVTAKAKDQLDPVKDSMDALGIVAPLLPDALGANGPRRYLIAVGNQAEMRASGGAPLTLAMVEFYNGSVTIPIKGQTSTQLFPPLNRPVKWHGPSADPFFPTNPRFEPFVNSNKHPNFVMAAQEIAPAWKAGDYPAVDGVITLDLTAIAAVLNATGAVHSDVYGDVTAEKLGQILLIDAYTQISDPVARQEANQALLQSLLERLLSGDQVISAMKAMAATAPGRHVQVWVGNEELQMTAEKYNFAGYLDPTPNEDWSAVYTQNANQSKVDVFQQRSTAINVALHADGGAHVTQTVTVTNATPPDRPEGPPSRIGYLTSWLEATYMFYAPNAAIDPQVTGPEGFKPKSFTNRLEFDGWTPDGFGHRLTRWIGWTPPGGTAQFTLTYDLPSGMFSTGQGLEYRLQADPQSTWNPAGLSVSVTPPTGWNLVPNPSVSASGQTAQAVTSLTGPVDLRVQFTK